MEWAVVVAALGASTLTGVVTYMASIRVAKLDASRAEREHRYRLERDVFERRVALRRERLVSLQDMLGRLIVLSDRLRVAADGVFAKTIGEPVYGDVDEEYREAGEAVRRFRLEELSSHPWWGVPNNELVELVRRLISHLRSIESEARQYAEFGGADQGVQERAKSAHSELDDTLTQIAELIEDLASGADLITGTAGPRDGV